MNDNAKVAFLSPLSSSQKEKNYSPSKQPDETASKSLELPLPTQSQLSILWIKNCNL